MRLQCSSAESTNPFLKIFCILLTFILAVLASSSRKITAAALPDLTVSNITTVGGLCGGNKNKISVNVWNGSNTPVTKPVTVRLTIPLADLEGASSYEATIPGGIGGQGGQTAWFNNVSVPRGKVIIQVLVDPKKEIGESNEGNNLKTITRAVTADCAQ